jgi:type IV secretory pathway component VirB8
MAIVKNNRFLIFIEHAMDNDHSQKTRRTTTSIAVIAIVATVALLGVVVLTVTVTIPLQQQADARGCTNGIAVNASKGRCFNH